VSQKFIKYQHSTRKFRYNGPLTATGENLKLTKVQ